MRIVTMIILLRLLHVILDPSRTPTQQIHISGHSYSNENNWNVSRYICTNDNRKETVPLVSKDV